MKKLTIKQMQNWKTTKIVGIAGAIISVLLVLGIARKEASGEIVPLVDSIWVGLLVFVAGINSLIVLFSKDK